MIVGFVVLFLIIHIYGLSLILYYKGSVRKEWENSVKTVVRDGNSTLDLSSCGVFIRKSKFLLRMFGIKYRLLKGTGINN